MITSQKPKAARRFRARSAARCPFVFFSAETLPDGSVTGIRPKPCRRATSSMRSISRCKSTRKVGGVTRKVSAPCGSTSNSRFCRVLLNFLASDGWSPGSDLPWNPQRDLGGFDLPGIIIHRLPGHRSPSQLRHQGSRPVRRP